MEYNQYHHYTEDNYSKILIYQSVEGTQNFGVEALYQSEYQNQI